MEAELADCFGLSVVTYSSLKIAISTCLVYPHDYRLFLHVTRLENKRAGNVYGKCCDPGQCEHIQGAANKVAIPCPTPIHIEASA
jgi:hypothetical protein